MNDKFVKRLTEFLDSECDDYDLTYSWEWNEDAQLCEVEVRRFNSISCVDFRYDEEYDTLNINMGYDYWYDITEYDHRVKYFWMKICPDVFPNK